MEPPKAPPAPGQPDLRPADAELAQCAERSPAEGRGDRRCFCQTPSGTEHCDESDLCKVSSIMLAWHLGFLQPIATWRQMTPVPC